MSARPVITPVRVEHYLLPILRAAFPDVTFTTVKDSSDSPPARECLIVGEPQQLASPISMYVRLRMSVYVQGESGLDFQAAQQLAAQIESEILSHGTSAPFIDAAHESGPIRIADTDGIFAYTIILLTVSVS